MNNALIFYNVISNGIRKTKKFQRENKKIKSNEKFQLFFFFFQIILKVVEK